MPMQFENYSKNVKNSKWFLDKRETRLKRVNKYMTARTTFDFAKFVDILQKLEEMTTRRRRRRTV